MKRTGELIGELQEAVLEQQDDINELRELIYTRTRIQYGTRDNLLVVEAVAKICDHLNVRFMYVRPDKRKMGWQLLVPSDDESEE